MHTFKVLSILCVIIFCVSILYGCGSDGNKGDLSMRFLPVTSEPQPEPLPDSQPEPEPSTISLSLDQLDLDNLAGTSNIQIKANCDWTISFRESSDIKDTTEIDWIKAEPSSGTGDCEVTLTFEDNKIPAPQSSIYGYAIFIKHRVCELVVTSKSGTTATASINQEGVTFNNVKLGDKIEFGRYPQSYDADINDSNSYEPLTWVVKKIGGLTYIPSYPYTYPATSVILTTEKVIDNKILDEHYIYYGYSVFLRSSGLLSFLNSDLSRKNVFNENEKKAMKLGYCPLTEVQGIDYLYYPSSPNDAFYVSIFTEYENEYDTTDESICCEPTEYAKKQGISISDSGYSPYWFLSYNNNHLPLYLSDDVLSQIDPSERYYEASTTPRCNLAIASDGGIFYEYNLYNCGVRPEIIIEMTNPVSADY